MFELNILKIDQLLGTLTTYEMRVGKKKSESKEVAFKVSNKAKDHKDHQDYFSCESDQHIDQFSWKLKRGLGKYKWMFPFK